MHLKRDGAETFLLPSPARSSWKTDRSKPQLKDLTQEEDPLPLIEDVLGNQDPASSEMPNLEEADKEATSGESCETDKKVEESTSEPRQLCTPEERRHLQRERLNQILLNLLDKIPGKNGEFGAMGALWHCGIAAAALGSLCCR